jgi:hypothetical protein
MVKNRMKPSPTPRNVEHFVAGDCTICDVKRVRRKIVWLFAVATGLCGGWLAAGALNNRRIDIPRVVSPTSQPSSNAPAAPR